MTAPELGPARRLAWLAGAFGSLALASPGVSGPQGSAGLALLAVTLWAATASRPGRFALPIEAGLSALAWAWICSWAALVHPFTLLWIAPGYGIYTALAGWTLRRLARRHPLALAAPAAWLLAETLRAVAPLPFGMEWMRLGTHLHTWGWLAGSARVWGFGGLGLVLAALGGLLAQVLRRERPTPVAWTLGLGPLLLAAALARAVPAPASVPGPSVLLVQPNIAQRRKMVVPDPTLLFLELAQLTLEGLRATAAAGREPPDLVCWGETMLPTFVVDPALPAAVEDGASFAPWVEAEWSAEDFRVALDVQQAWVDEILLGAGEREALIPAGTSFLSGAEHVTVREGVIRRQSGVFLWPAPGTPRGPVTKRYLVPSAETMFGLERFAWVRAAMFSLAGYLPDLHSDTDASRRLAFTARDGRTYHVGVSVCYDNAFDEPFVRPLHEGPVDFHVVASNEAWFKRGLEFDQMMAFSRLEAIATGRAIVRTTNSGVSAVLGPDGGEVARLVAEGRDRDVAGTLWARVPVPPTSAEAGRRTPFVRSAGLWSWLWTAVPLLLLAAAGRRSLREGDAGPGNRPARAG